MLWLRLALIKPRPTRTRAPLRWSAAFTPLERENQGGLKIFNAPSLPALKRRERRAPSPNYAKLNQSRLSCGSETIHRRRHGRQFVSLNRTGTGLRKPPAPRPKRAGSNSQCATPSSAASSKAENPLDLNRLTFLTWPWASTDTSSVTSPLLRLAARGVRIRRVGIIAVILGSARVCTPLTGDAGLG